MIPTKPIVNGRHSPDLLVSAALLLTNMIVWLPSLGQYFYYEDFLFLSESRSFSFYKLLFGGIENFSVRPISQYWIIYLMQKIYGLNPWYYHLSLLLCHVLLRWLFFGVPSK